MKIEVVIHDQILEGVLENTDSARAFYQMLPLSLTMNELNAMKSTIIFQKICLRKLMFLLLFKRVI